MASNPPSSPSSSPRLPSPPPMAEDQTAPQSPGLRASDSGLPSSQTAPAEQAASRRIRPGTKAADIAEGPPLIELTEIDSAFQLTEHMKALYFSHTHPIHLPAITIPISAPVALLLSTPPSSTDRALWLYELCRFLVQKVNLVVTSLFADQPPCSASTCQEMRASEWQYLCAVHDPPKACCAIDYCCHTLDWAANVLTNPKHFPSRLALGTDSTAGQHQVRQLTHVFRRVYRIFAHAWFSHREMFWRVEGQTGLYVFFKTVCDVYNLLPEDGYTIPAEAESKEQAQPATTEVSGQAEFQSAAAPPPTILKRPPPPENIDTENRTSNAAPISPPQPAVTNNPNQLPPPINTTNATGTTARRHRHTPSTGASPVETVMEENEEDDAAEPKEQDSHLFEISREEPPTLLQSPPKSISLVQPQPQQPPRAFSPFSQDPNPTPTPRSDMPLFPQVPGSASASSSTEDTSEEVGPAGSQVTAVAETPSTSSTTETGVVAGRYATAPETGAELPSTSTPPEPVVSTSISTTSGEGDVASSTDTTSEERESKSDEDEEIQSKPESSESASEAPSRSATEGRDKGSEEVQSASTEPRVTVQSVED